jgi:aryl-alcohol dehydrogenase-like predicted oxidoreductase
MPSFPNRVTLGRTGLSVCPLAVSGGYGAPDKSLLRAFDRGVNYWYHGSMLKPGMTSAIRQLVASSHHRPNFVELAKDPRYGILHIRYNAAHTGAERDVFPNLAAENRPGIVAYTATRWGSLLSAKNAPKGEAPMRGRDAYRFVLSNPDFNLCMTGPKNAEQLDEALAALDEGPLSPEENERIRRLGSHLYAKAFRKG